MVSSLFSSLVVALALCGSLSSASTAAVSPSSHDLVARQASTVALTLLNTGPVTYVTTTCALTCAALTNAGAACTSDVCACATSAPTVSCMNCVLADATVGQQSIIVAGFNAYAEQCVAEGNFAVVPDLVTGTGAAATTTGRTSTTSTTSRATRTSTAGRTAATGTLGHPAFGGWLSSIGQACASACGPVQNDYAGCGTDACICTMPIIMDGQDCQSCALRNAEGTFTTSQLATLHTLWTRIQAVCDITSPGGGSANTLTTTDQSGRTITGAPSQVYYSPSTTATRAASTGGVIANAGTASSGATGSFRSLGGTALTILVGGLAVFLG